MNPGDAAWRGADTAQLDWSEDGCPRSSQFGDVYFSRADGLLESRHVFLAGNDLPKNWAQTASDTFTVVETGFGTGLNFLATWQAWRDAEHRPQCLHFLSIERYPLDIASLARAAISWPELAELAQQLVDNYPPLLPGKHRLLFDGGSVQLDLLVADIDAAMAELQELDDLKVDAWFLDGFAPAQNPAMWTDSLYLAMAQLSQPGTRLATFTAAGHVRRGLEIAGFEMQKKSGYGKKRDMLAGHFAAPATARPPTQTPWHLHAQKKPALREAIVLGAGLAGATIASSLSRRGWSVKVLESANVASGASGNEQGVLYTRVSHRQSELNDFSLHSYQFALRYYQDLLARGLLKNGTDAQLCGALHLQRPPAIDHPLHQTLKSLPDLARFIDSAQASKITGLSVCDGGLFFPGAGWINPPTLCQNLLNAPGIEVHEQLGDLTLQRDRTSEYDLWCAVDASGEQIARAEIAIVACGEASNSLQSTQWLPLQAIRGQVTHIPSRGALQQLQTVICHDGYLSPARQDQHCIGATFDINDTESRLRHGDQVYNLEKLATAVPTFASVLNDLHETELGGKVGFRAASPDYLPMIGPVPEYDSYIEDFAQLRKNARRTLDQRGSFLPGLYVSTGHGSRGLTSCPLGAELLASHICGEAWPVDSQLCRALSPARFLIRDLIRNRL